MARFVLQTSELLQEKVIDKSLSCIHQVRVPQDRDIPELSAMNQTHLRPYLLLILKVVLQLKM